MKEKVKSLTEGVSESTAACLLAMVQGNILALTLGHIAIALQTGVIAGSIALAFSLVLRAERIWVTPLLLGISTAVVDYFVHPSSFGAAATEALVTGFVAGLLALLLRTAVKLIQRRKGKLTTG